MKVQHQKAQTEKLSESVSEKHLPFSAFLKLVVLKPALCYGGVGEQVTQELALRWPVLELAQFGKIVFLS